MTTAELIAAVEAIPNHEMGGYECEWDCSNRADSQFPNNSRFPNCPYWDEPETEHRHELVSRERVLILLRGAS